MLGKETRTRILEAAKKAFSEKGFDGVSVDEIAKRAGVRKALIYYYFPSKEILFEEVWKNALNELEKYLFGEVKNENVYIRKIKRFLRAYVNFVTSRSVLNKIIEKEKASIMDTSGETWERLKERYRDFIKRVAQLIEEGKRRNYVHEDIDSRAAAELIVNSIGEVPKDENTLRSIQTMILRGLLKFSGEP